MNKAPFSREQLEAAARTFFRNSKFNNIKLPPIFQSRIMQLTIFIASFAILLFALCAYIPYIGIIAIILTLILAICVGVLGVISKMRFAWISSIIGTIAAIIAIPFQIVYLVQGSMQLGEYLIENGQLAWAQTIAPHLISTTEAVAPELTEQAQRYQNLVNQVSAVKQTALNLGATPEEAEQQALLIFRQLVKQEDIHFGCGPGCTHHHHDHDHAHGKDQH